MSLYISQTDEMSHDAQTRRSTVRALLESHDPNLKHFVLYKAVHDNAVAIVKDDLMKWSRSCLVSKERANDVDLYTKTLDQTIVADRRDQPVEVQADGFPVVAEEPSANDDAGNNADGGQVTSAAEAGDSMPTMARGMGAPRNVHWICANCGEHGHTLGDCVTPTLAGCDIAGCPMCNTKGHSFDECHNTKYLGPEAVLNFLYFRRGGKCQIRSDREIFVLLKQYVEHHELQGNDVSEMLEVEAPWTRSFTFEFLQKPENLEKLKGYSGYGSATHQPLEEDPTITQEDILAGTISSGYSSYHQKKEAAALAAYLEKKSG
ncbi:hypothetical protein PG993_007913 [Apiospora rasikravindrae]|uniref:CCHC-type domain-containing protein n=1 Tax=Apiospora rasikravindrae TaxID=990691 RepID=A0ABR1SZ74_9PEZI